MLLSHFSRDAVFVVCFPLHSLRAERVDVVLPHLLQPEPAGVRPKPHGGNNRQRCRDRVHQWTRTLSEQYAGRSRERQDPREILTATGRNFHTDMTS